MLDYIKESSVCGRYGVGSRQTKELNTGEVNTNGTVAAVEAGTTTSVVMQ